MSNRSVKCTIAIFICCFSSAHSLAAEDIVFRTSVMPENPWVGQQTLLKVDVLAKDGWAQLKKITDAEVRGAYLMRLESQGTRLNETIDGDSYTGQRYEFMIFAQRDGTFDIPPTPVDVEVTTWGAGDGAKVHRMALPPVRFVARTPPGAEGIRGLVSTSNLTVTQSWDPDGNDMLVGNTLTRTINFAANDVSGMAFAPLRSASIDGIGIYASEPTVNDDFYRGSLAGSRIETITYVFETAGEVEIPAFELFWWDVGNSELKRIELPGLSLRIDANPAAAPTSGSAASLRSNSQFIWYVLAGFALILILAFRFGRQLIDLFAAWRIARRETEAVYFGEVMRAARSGEQNAMLRETMRWLDRIGNDANPARLDKFLQQYGDGETQTAAAALMSNLNNPVDEAELKTFAAGLANARGRWQKAGRAQRKVSSLLPALNGRS